ncbi:MAG: helix-turn-helix domain-containing protein [Actinobacteria bacterium]|nr:helix-turn-helix domain-containing protein [Actinomycetota bacterium]
MHTSIYSLLADDLTQNLDRFIDLLAERTMAELPELTDDAERYAFARTGARSLMTDFVAVLELGAVDARYHAPAAAIALAQRFARDGVPIAVMLRAYRLGQELVFDRAVHASERIGQTEDRAQAIAALGALSFRYMDGVMSDVSRHYDTEREKAFRGRDARRLVLVRALLSGAPVDPVEAERGLEYRVDGEHQAVVAWSSGGDDERLVTAATRIAAEIGEGRTLTIGDPAGEVTVWTRPTPDVGDPENLARIAEDLRKQSIQTAIGEPGRGLRGLAATKRQADLARAVAELRPDRTITRYANVALATVLLRDEDVARAFAGEQLGRVAHATRAAHVLRETLTTFYATGHDRSRTARALGVHRNTIANRLRRAEGLLGHRVDERVRETEAALVIVDALPTERTSRDVV